MCRSGLLPRRRHLAHALHRKKAHLRHAPDDKTSYFGTMLASPV
jgi:hypothetical protein